MDPHGQPGDQRSPEQRSEATVYREQAENSNTPREPDRRSIHATAHTGDATPTTIARTPVSAGLE